MAVLLQDLRISVTDRCNFRCAYCMPAEIFGERYEFLPRDQILTFEEIERLTRIFAGLGVTKIRVTGGEPLLRRDLPELIRKLAAVDGIQDLSLTTNGYLLPPMAKELQEAGLRRVTISLDSLDDETFKRMNGRGFGVDRVLEAIQAAEDAGLGPIKINSVVQRGINDNFVTDLARYFKGTDKIVRFIEYMDVGTINGLEAGRGGAEQGACRPHQRRGAHHPHRPQLPQRDLVTLCLCGRHGRDWIYLIGVGAVLRRLHTRPSLHRRQALHLPVHRRGP